MITYYTILSVAENASFEEIENSYKKKVFEYHPDFNKEIHDKQMFEAIQKAFDTLSNFEKRKEYDNELMIYRNDRAAKHSSDTVIVAKEELHSVKQESKWRFLSEKEWIFIYIIFALKLFLQIGVDNPLTFRDLTLSIAECLGFAFGAFLPALFVTFISRIFFGKYLNRKTFAYIVLVVFILGLIGNIIK